MTPESLRDHVAKPSVKTVEKLSERDVHELSDAAESAIEAGGGFGWLDATTKIDDGGLLARRQNDPDRHLIVGRLDKVIAGSCQIIRPPKNNEAQKFVCQLMTFLLHHGAVVMVWRR